MWGRPFTVRLRGIHTQSTKELRAVTAAITALRIVKGIVIRLPASLFQAPVVLYTLADHGRLHMDTVPLAPTRMRTHMDTPTHWCALLR